MSILVIPVSTILLIIPSSMYFLDARAYVVDSGMGVFVQTHAIFRNELF
jgi:hypothetical protein